MWMSLIQTVHFGTILGAEITRQTGTGLPDDTVVINCHGAGGQSFRCIYS